MFLDESFEINEGIRMRKTVLHWSALSKWMQKDTLKCPGWPFKYSGSYNAWNTGLKKTSEVRNSSVSQNFPDKIWKKQHSLGFVFIDKTLQNIVSILYAVSWYPK